MTTPKTPHLPGCYKTSRADPSRYACNCGADSQNELRAMLDRVEASAHSYRVGDASPETAEPCGEPDREDERADATRAAYEAALAEDPTMPRRAWRAATFAADVSREAMCAARRELVKDATAQHERARYRVASAATRDQPLLPFDEWPDDRPADASLEVRRAFDAFKAWCEADGLPRDARWLAVVRAVDASRPTLTEEQARAWAEQIGDMIEAHGLDISIIAAAILRASRGELGPTKPGAQ